MLSKKRNVFDYKAVIISDAEKFEFDVSPSSTINITTADRQEIFTPNKLQDIDVVINTNNLIQFIQ